MSTAITDLPNEIIAMIYDLLLYSKHADDVINLSLVCLRIYNAMSDEHKRVFGLRKRYISINAAISDIKYYITEKGVLSLSLRIFNRAVCHICNNGLDRQSNLYEIVIFDKIAATYINYECGILSGKSFFVENGSIKIAEYFDE